MKQIESDFSCPERLNEVAKLFSSISGMTFDESVDIILTTADGKAIMRNNSSVLYEQTTENVWAIARELGERNHEIKKKFTIEKIVDAYNQEEVGVFHTSRNVFPSASALKKKQNAILRRAKMRRSLARTHTANASLPPIAQ